MGDLLDFKNYKPGETTEDAIFELAGLFYANVMDTERRLKIATHAIFPKLMKNWINPKFDPLGMYTTIGKIRIHLITVGSLHDDLANTLERVANLRNAFMHWSINMDERQSERGLLWDKIKMAYEGKILRNPKGKLIRIGGYDDLMEVRRYLDAAGLAFAIFENRPGDYPFENKEKKLAAQNYFKSVGWAWGFDMSKVNRNLELLKLDLSI